MTLDETGWAALITDRAAVLVPLTAALADAGESLAELARLRARDTGADPADVLAGNACLALESDARHARGAAAACLAAIARVTGHGGIVVTVTRDADVLDCAVEPAAPGRVRARCAALAGVAESALAPGSVVGRG